MDRSAKHQLILKVPPQYLRSAGKEKGKRPSFKEEKVMDFFGEDKWDLLCEAGRLEDGFYIETLRIKIRSLVRIIRGTYSVIKIEERIRK